MYLEPFKYKIPRSKKRISVLRYTGSPCICDIDASILFRCTLKDIRNSFSKLLSTKTVYPRDSTIQQYININRRKVQDDRIHYSTPAIIAMGYELNPTATRPFADWLQCQTFDSYDRGKKDFWGEFTSASGDASLRLCYVAFADILGIRSLIENGRDLEVTAFRDALRKSALHLEDPASEHLNTQIRYFSDCVSMITPANFELDVYAEGSFARSVLPFSHWQLSMVLEGFFVRGGLAFGKAYTDENTIYGKAHMDAYLLESKLAVNPRMILHGSTMDLVNEQQGYYSRTSQIPHDTEIAIDIDGIPFLNYLNQAYEYDCPELVVKNHGAIIREKISEGHIGKVASKYFWSAHYHNWFCYQKYNEGLGIKKYAILGMGAPPAIGRLPRVNWLGKS